MTDPIAILRATMLGHQQTDGGSGFITINGDVPLRELLHEVDRICSLPFWIEEITGHMPTDAALLSWDTVADVERWIAATLAHNPMVPA